MNKAQLSDAIAAEANLTKADSKKALDAFTKTIADVLKQGDKFDLINKKPFEEDKSEDEDNKEKISEDELGLYMLGVKTEGKENTN